jgi:hypothetical protein
LDRQLLMLTTFHLAIILLGSCMVFPGCVTGPRPLTWPASLLPLGAGVPAGDEYEVIYAVLDGHSHVQGSTLAYKGTYFLHSETTAEVYTGTSTQQTAHLQTRIRSLPPAHGCSAPSADLISRFVVLNQERVPHQQSASLPPGYEFGDRALPASNGFYAQELVGVSRVAFSSDLQSALIYVEWYTGISSGGEYFLLRREGATWRIACALTSWTGG